MGGKRGRITPMSERQSILTDIDNAVKQGAHIQDCLKTLELSYRTYLRWKKDSAGDRRKGAPKTVARKLSTEEENLVIQYACDSRFADATPYTIIPTLLDEGIYIASERTFYRLLKKYGLLHHRQKSRAGRRHSKPKELKATGPNQVWSWDITYLKTEVRGIYLFAYVIVDVWSRKIVGWEIHDRESDEIAAAMFERVSRKKNIRGVKLHSDNGNPMKGSTMIMMLYHLGVTPSFSRPRVSNDNPYSESLFKTLKYSRRYPECFKDLQSAGSWFAGFVHWYNYEHKHSSIGYVTPQERHLGRSNLIFKKRNEVMKKHRIEKSCRWGKKVFMWKSTQVVYLNRMPELLDQDKSKSA
jgi:putative transposase